MHTEFNERVGDLMRLMRSAQQELDGLNSFLDASKADCQFTRRTMVRTIFACIEAYVSHLKQSTLLFSTDQPNLFQPVEILALRDEESFIADNGKLGTRGTRIRFRTNLQLAFSSFARASGREYSLNFGDARGARFIEAVTVRDRITHPKSADAWEVSESEVALVQDAWCWFGEHLVAVSRPQSS
jgi:hypothetical protein